MKRLRSILAALALTGCTCTTPRTDDIGIDTSAPDAGLDAPIRDAPFVLPDVPVRAPLCGPSTPRPAPSRAQPPSRHAPRGRALSSSTVRTARRRPRLPAARSAARLGRLRNAPWSARRRIATRARLPTARAQGCPDARHLPNLVRLAPGAAVHSQRSRSGPNATRFASSTCAWWSGAPTAVCSRRSSAARQQPLGVLPPRIAAAVRDGVGVRHPRAVRMRPCR
jgi:hypothetical protein